MNKFLSRLWSQSVLSPFFPELVFSGSFLIELMIFVRVKCNWKFALVAGEPKPISLQHHSPLHLAVQNRTIFYNHRIEVMPHKSKISLLELIPGQCYGNVFTCSRIDRVFNDCGEMLSTGQQCQLPKLVLQVDWKAKDIEKRQTFLELRLVSFIMTAGKKKSLNLGSDWWSCEVKLVNSTEINWVEYYQHLIISLLWNTGLSSTYL